MVRTSTSCATPCARKSAIRSSMARVPWPMVRITCSRSAARGQLGASVVRTIRKRRGSSVETVMYGRESVVVEGAGALECPAPLLPRLRLLPLPLDRRLLVVGAPFHLLKEAVLLHLLLERLQRGLDLVVDDLDPHSAAPQVRGRSIAAHRLGAINDVHLHEPLRPLRHGAGDRRKGLVRLLDDLARVVDDPPTPVRIHRSRPCDDLHLGLAPTTDSRCARRRRRPCGTHRRSDRRPSPKAWRARPSASGHRPPDR